MREVRHTSKFRRDLKRELKSNNAKFLEYELSFVVNLLSSDFQLPEKYLDHALRGKYQGSRECHLRPDLLLIYRKIEKSKLLLEQLGSHSEVFS